MKALTYQGLEPGRAARVRPFLVRASGVLRVLLALVAISVTALIISGSATKTLVLAVSGTVGELAVITGIVRYRLYRYRSFVIILCGGLVSLIGLYLPSPISEPVRQVGKLAFAASLILVLHLGSRFNGERGQGLRIWIEAAIVWTALDAWFIAALPRAWRASDPASSKFVLFVLSPSTAVFVFVPSILLLARLKWSRAAPGPGIFVASFCILWAALIANTANVAADGNSAATKLFLVAMVVAICGLGWSMLEPSMVTFADGRAPWRPLRSWARAAMLLAVPAVVVGAVSIGATTWTGVLWPILMLVSIGLMVVRTWMIAERRVARMATVDRPIDPTVMDPESLRLWYRTASTEWTAGEIVVLAVISDPRRGLPGALDAGGELMMETVRRIRELTSTAQNLDPTWTGRWAIGHDGDRMLLVHARDVSRSAATEDSDELAASVDRLGEWLRGWLATPFRLQDETVRLEFAIGSAFREAHVGPGGDAYLVSTVQDAIWAAQSSSGGAPQRFDPHLRGQVARRARLAAALDDALLDRSGLSLVYEPLVDLRTGRSIGAEALARWNPPGLGPVTPGEFIPIAERNGSILDLGEFVLDTACRAAAAESSNRLIAVNLSGVEVGHPDFYERVMRVVDAAKVDPSLVVLEITESVANAVVSRATPALLALSAAGLKLSIDDFGTESSGLHRLLALPWWSLKLDRSMVAQVNEVGSPSALMVRTVVNLCDEVGVKVVAEGIETAGSLELMTALGCHLAQGWLFGRGRARLADAWADQRPEGVAFPGVVPPQPHR